MASVDFHVYGVIQEKSTKLQCYTNQVILSKIAYFNMGSYLKA
jgi:hypothetical protein